MRVLVDTNVLARSAQPAHEKHDEACQGLRVVHARRNELCVAPQIMYEFDVLCTRPDVQCGGLGMTLDRADAQLTRILSNSTLLPDPASTLSVWRELLRQPSVVGKTAHDARIAAVMLVHGVQHLLTYNVADFKRYTHLQVFAPASVIAAPQASSASP
jgi:predicted nucleic acid-binding protein